jgi:hypothetical protein
MFKPQTVILITVLACPCLFAAPPVRKFDAPGSPPFEVLKTRENPPLDVDGNFVIGPEYVSAPERHPVTSVPQGKVQQFVIDQAPQSRNCPQWVWEGGSEEPEDVDRRDSQHRLQAEDHCLHSSAIPTGK